MSSFLDEQVEKLCRAIPEEKDSDRMMLLVKQLNELLEARESASTRPHFIAPNAQPTEISDSDAPRERQSA